jgi:uncharacterized protein (TIGR02145 family)
MDRNLGATQVATSSSDANAYGDLYQWGRRSDGHQCRNSSTTTNLSSTDQPMHGNFITSPVAPYDWRSPQNNNLWQGTYGDNNPCPSGYRIPSMAELDVEVSSWSSNNTAGAFASTLKLTTGGSRRWDNGVIQDIGYIALYWSSSVSTYNSALSFSLLFATSGLNTNSGYRAGGYSVRCIKD